MARQGAEGSRRQPHSPGAGAALGRGAVILGTAMALAACSINLPMSSLISEPESTGSIVPASPPMQLGLTDGDWAQASVALDKALDPQQAGAAAKWTNAETGRAGVFVAAGPAFIRDDQVCRAFKASLAQHPQDQRLFGTACRVGGGAWTLQKVKPLMEGA